MLTFIFSSSETLSFNFILSLLAARGESVQLPLRTAWMNDRRWFKFVRIHLQTINFFSDISFQFKFVSAHISTVFISLDIQQNKANLLNWWTLMLLKLLNWVELKFFYFINPQFSFRGGGGCLKKIRFKEVILFFYSLSLPPPHSSLGVILQLFKFEKHKKEIFTGFFLLFLTEKWGPHMFPIKHQLGTASNSKIS